MDGRLALSEAGLQHLASCIPEICQQVAGRLAPVSADNFQSASARRAVLETLRDHLLYLQASFEMGTASPFIHYVRWWSDVLRRRGDSSKCFAEELDRIIEALEERLPKQDCSDLKALISMAREALEKPEPIRAAYYDYVSTSHPAADVLTDSLVDGQRMAAKQLVIDAIVDGQPLVDLGLQLIQPAMYDVGQRWQENRISIAQEHLATVIVESLLAQAFTLADFSEPVQRRGLFACVQHNHHALGVRMMADVFEVAGWEIQCLGADVPTTSLVEQIDRFRPEFIGLSISLPQQIATARQVIQQVRGDFQTHCPVVVVGGLATNQFGDLTKHLRADAWSPDARAVLRELS